MRSVLLAISLMFLTACTVPFSGPKYVAGTCLQLDYDEVKESWEKPKEPAIFKILEIGKEKYRIIWVAPKSMYGYPNDSSIRTIDRVYKEVKCPPTKPNDLF